MRKMMRSIWGMRKDKIKIMHVAQAAGGVDHYIRMLLKYLDKDKFVNILVCSEDYYEEDYKGLVDSFEQIEMTRAIGTNDLKAIGKIRKLIKKYAPEIVYAHSSKAGALTRMADIGIKNFCIYNPHGWAFNMQCSAKKRMMYTVIERIAAPFCDKIICISDAEKQSALENKICKEENIPFTYDGLAAGGTDSGELHKVYDGVVNMTLSIPCRYFHSHSSIVHEDDLDATVKLLTSFIKKLTFAD